METFILFLSLTIILSYNYVVSTKASSTDELSKSEDNSESSRPGTAHERLKNHKRNIRWTKELKSELLDLWEKADPSREGYGQRLYDLWSQKHKEYSHFSPTILKIQVERSIRKWKGPFDERYFARLRILNQNKKFPWTPELKTNLLKCSAQSHRNRTELKRLWDETNPRYTYLDSKFLGRAANNFYCQAKRGKIDKKQVVWNEERQAELMDIWDKFYSPDKKSGHTKDIFDEWKRRHPDLCNFNPSHLKNIANSIIQQDTIERLARGERSEKLQRRMEYIEYINTRPTWTPKMISDLSECCLVHKFDRKGLQTCWQKMQPEYAHFNAIYLHKMNRLFLQTKNPITRKVRGHDKHSEEHIDGDDGANANGNLQLHQATSNQHTPYKPRFGVSQHEHKESFTVSLPSQHSFTSQLSHCEPHFEGTHLIYSRSFSGSPHSNHFISTYKTSYPHQSGVSYQWHGVNLSPGTLLMPISHDQQSLEYQECKIQKTLQKEPQRSKSPEDKEDLDLDLHLK